MNLDTFHHIVVAYDGQDESSAALTKGIQLSKQLGTRLTVVHVYQAEHAMNTGGVRPGIPSAPANGYLTDNLQNYPVAPDAARQFDDQPKNEYFDHSDEVTSRIRMKLDENQATGNVEILSGSPADAILSFADEHAADLIIMGNSDSGSLKKLLFGGVSDKVHHQSNISVLIAK